MKNYYQILNLPNCAPMDDVRRSYRALALRHHPDRGGDVARMQEINDAYDYLLKNKADYDRRLQPQRVRPRREGFSIYVGGVYGWGMDFGMGVDSTMTTGTTFNFRY